MESFPNHKLKEKRISKMGQRQRNDPKACPVCGLVINNPWGLTCHIKRHNKERPYKCKECPASFVVPYELKNHTLLHTNEGPVYTCTICSKKFRSKVGMRLHEDTHGYNEYKCRFCNEKFTMSAAKSKHEASHKNSEFKCSYCYKVFSSLHYKEKHEEVHTERNSVKKIIHRRRGSQRNRGKPSGGSKDNSHKCIVCPAHFSGKQEYFNHVQSLHPDYIDELFQFCEICGKCFSRKGYFFRYHMRAHLGEVKSCPVCEYQTAYGRDLEWHIKTVHTSDAPFACTVCGKRFKIKLNLKKHLLLHGEKEFHCNLCSKSYYSKDSLSKHHIYVHQKTMVKCELCGSEMASKHLNRHMDVQHPTARAEIICEHCGKIFPSIGQLKQHLWRETRRPQNKTPATRKCPHCKLGIKNDSKCSLIEHCKRQHPSKVGGCLVCNFFTLNFDHYRHHNRKHLNKGCKTFELSFHGIECGEAISEEEVVGECFLCGFFSPSSGEMAIHRESHKAFVQKRDWFDGLDEHLMGFAKALGIHEDKGSTNKKMVHCKEMSMNKVVKRFRFGIRLSSERKFFRLTLNMLDKWAGVEAKCTSKNPTFAPRVASLNEELDEDEPLALVEGNLTEDKDSHIDLAISEISPDLSSGLLVTTTHPQNPENHCPNLANPEDPFPKVSLHSEPKLETFFGKKFLAIDDLRNLNDNDIFNFIRGLKSS